MWFLKFSFFGNYLTGYNLTNISKVKTMQKLLANPLDEIGFNIIGNENINSVKNFTTRPDTLFGYSF